jgi:hypothetical protein
MIMEVKYIGSLSFGEVEFGRLVPPQAFQSHHRVVDRILRPELGPELEGIGDPVKRL